MSTRTRVGEVGAIWVRPVTSGSAEQWLAAVWVRDLDGRRRLVKARRPGRREAELALQERLAHRRPLGFRGAEPDMTVQELAEYWLRRRLEEARPRATSWEKEGRRGDEVGAVSPQTLAGYQTAFSQIINPRLGGLRLTEARAGVVDEALARVDHTGRTTRVARSVLAQMFAMAVRHDALASNPMREVRHPPRRLGPSPLRSPTRARLRRARRCWLPTTRSWGSRRNRRSSRAPTAGRHRSGGRSPASRTLAVSVPLGALGVAYRGPSCGAAVACCRFTSGTRHDVRDSVVSVAAS